MVYDPSTKISDIMKEKRADIRRAPLAKGSPSWDEIVKLTWGDIENGSKLRLPGYQTLRKLLLDRRFNR